MNLERRIGTLNFCEIFEYEKCILSGVVVDVVVAVFFNVVVVVHHFRRYET